MAAKIQQPPWPTNAPALDDVINGLADAYVKKILKTPVIMTRNYDGPDDDNDHRSLSETPAKAASGSPTKAPERALAAVQSERNSAVKAAEQEKQEKLKALTQLAHQQVQHERQLKAIKNRILTSAPTSPSSPAAASVTEAASKALSLLPKDNPLGSPTTKTTLEPPRAKRIAARQATGGSKKRTVTIKSDAMPKTVKGLKTRKKLLEKKIKDAETKVKLNKNRVIRLK